MPTDFVVDVNNSDDIVTARQAGHELARQLGFSLTDVTMIATAISEIARNITSYAGRGEVRVGVQYRDGRKALVVRAEDDGPGIADIERALEDGYSTGRGLGLGLPGARRLMDRLIVESAPGKGTVVEMWKWIPPDAYEQGWIGPIEWAAARRPRPGEEVCGDFPIAVDVGGERPRCSAWRTGWATARRPSTAALRAVEVVEPLLAPNHSTSCCSCVIAAWPRHRGAAITLARIDFETDTLSWIGIGNVDGRPCRQTARRCRDPCFCAAGRRHHGLPHTPRDWPPNRFRSAPATCS